jgi:hypothetical protein
MQLSSFTKIKLRVIRISPNGIIPMNTAVHACTNFLLGLCLFKSMVLEKWQLKRNRKLRNILTVPTRPVPDRSRPLGCRPSGKDGRRGVRGETIGRGTSHLARYAGRQLDDLYVRFGKPYPVRHAASSSLRDQEPLRRRSGNVGHGALSRHSRNARPQPLSGPPEHGDEELEARISRRVGDTLANREEYQEADEWIGSVINQLETRGHIRCVSSCT